MSCGLISVLEGKVAVVSWHAGRTKSCILLTLILGNGLQGELELA